jgi:hypothetical protein
MKTRQINEKTQNRKLKQGAKHTPTPIPKRGEPRCSWKVNSSFISKDKGQVTQSSPQHSSIDSNSTCTTEDDDNKCRCTALYYDNNLSNSNVGGTCVLSKLY